MSNQLSTTRRHNLNADWRDVLDLAKVVHDSKLYEKKFKSPQEVLVIMLHGRDLGLTETEALRSLSVVNGQVQESGGLIASRIQSSGKYVYRIIESTALKCSAEFFQVNGSKRESLGIETYTMEDAKTAGDAGKDTYKKHPKDMLFNRVMSKGYKRFAPDIFTAPVYSDDEIEEVNITPEPVIAAPEWHIQKATVAQPTTQQNHDEYEEQRAHVMRLIKYLRSKESQSALKETWEKENGKVMTFKDRSLTLQDLHSIESLIYDLDVPEPEADTISLWGNLDDLWRMMATPQRELAFERFVECIGYDFSFTGTQRDQVSGGDIETMIAICKDICMRGDE